MLVIHRSTINWSNRVRKRGEEGKRGEREQNLVDHMSNDSSVSPPSLRILCLHDGNSSAEELHAQLQSLDQALHRNHKVELVYINSPLRDAKEEPNQKDNGGRVWWEKSESEEEYSGLDATLLHVKQVMSSMPFSGVLAVGHGAALAAFLPFMGNSLEFGIFVHGASLLEEEERLIEDWPVLHIIGTRMRKSEAKNPV